MLKKKPKLIMMPNWIDHAQYLKGHFEDSTC